MIALKAEDVKSFTSRLFIKEDFDSFWVREVNIVTYNSFTMDGHIRSGIIQKRSGRSKGSGSFLPGDSCARFVFLLSKEKSCLKALRSYCSFRPDRQSVLLRKAAPE